MRIAAMLANLARCINRYIFQPTYLLDGDDKIRQLLLRLAMADRKNESFCRAVLISMCPEVQVNNAAKAVERVVRDVSWSVRKLISEAQHDRLKQGLEDVVCEARDTWQLVRCAREKFEVTFEPKSCDEIEWRPLKSDDRNTVAGKESKMRTSDRDDVLLVIFPPLYIVEDNEPDPVTPGIALMKSQSAAAAEEIEKKRPPVSTRGRSGLKSKAIRSRTMSTSLDSGSDFLPQLPPSKVH